MSKAPTARADRKGAEPRALTAKEVQSMFDATDLARANEIERELRIQARLEREAENYAKYGQPDEWLP